jgi:hypothetical protein
MENKKYAVICDTEYYGGDCQHPKGWSVSVATYADEKGESPCIGTLEECRAWLDDIYDGRIYLNHGEAGKSYRIAEIIDDDAIYDSWIDSQSWDGCPYEEPKNEEEHGANCEWAETKIYGNKGYLYINHHTNYNGLIVDLSTEA